MKLADALHVVGEGDRPESFALFSRTLDMDWVRRVLRATGTASIRKRKLPAEVVAWLVIGMAPLRHFVTEAPARWSLPHAGATA